MNYVSGRRSSNLTPIPFKSVLTILPVILIGSSVSGGVKIIESSLLVKKGNLVSNKETTFTMESPPASPVLKWRDSGSSP